MTGNRNSGSPTGSKPAGTGIRGRRLSPQQTDRTRAAISTTQIVKRLSSFVNGEIEMLPHQVTAALGLLKKVLPDLAIVDGNLNVRHTHEDALSQLEDAVEQSAPEYHDGAVH